MFAPESSARIAHRSDPVGQIVVIALLTVLTFSIIQALACGWASPATLWLADLLVGQLTATRRAPSCAVSPAAKPVSDVPATSLASVRGADRPTVPSPRYR